MLHSYGDIAWESEFHELGEGEFNLDAALFGINFLGVFVSFRDILVFFKLRRKAKIKESISDYFTQIQVKCPYCQEVNIEEMITRNYICPFCNKKSYIDTSGGVSTFYLRKNNKK